MVSTFLCSLQAKDSDDEEEVVHVDRDHFMDEFFEQVTELPRPPDPGRGPQPTTPFSLPAAPCVPRSLLPIPLGPLSSPLGLAHLPDRAPWMPSPGLRTWAA